MSESIILPYSPTVKKTNFRGSAEYNLKVMKYLKKKYKNYCVIIPEVKNKKYIEHEDVSLRWIQTKGKEGYFSIPKNYWDLFQKCQNKRFILFPFGFSCADNQGHANYMIYDRDTRSLERFEPYGKTKRECTNPFNIDAKIKNLFQKNLGKDFIKIYYKPLDFLDSNSIQRKQEDEGEHAESDPTGGFCAAFVSFYAELRMENPNKDRKRVIKLAINSIKENYSSLTEYIRGYSQNIVKETKYL
jgi:hypothetical protein